MKKIFIILALLTLSTLEGAEAPPIQIGVGGGYFEGGPRHTGGLYQVEYRFGGYLFWRIRPEAVLIFPEMKSIYFGLGAGMEIYVFKHLLFFPNFCPGLYYQGGGRNLGYPIEFRSSIEMAYEFTNKVRLAAQFYHISNASLSKRNPGANAYALLLFLPLTTGHRCSR